MERQLFDLYVTGLMMDDEVRRAKRKK